MAYLAINKDNTTVLCDTELYRMEDEWMDTNNEGEIYYNIYTDTTTTINHNVSLELTGKLMTWEDEPIQI